jgi:ferrous iron transport protein A
MNRNNETSLDQAGCGRAVRVTRLDTSHEAHQRLREMGFHENACIRKLQSHGAALICLVCGVRVAISSGLAQKIFVQELAWH